MMTEASKELSEEAKDPFAEVGSTQRWAVVWFVVVLGIGASLTFAFSKIDWWMYTNNAQVLDFRAYEENRSAFTSIGSEVDDTRVHGDLASARAKLLDEGN